MMRRFRSIFDKLVIEAINTVIRRGADVLPIIASAMVVVIHLLAGIIDERKVVLRPVGHLTLFLVFSWPIALMAAAVAVLARRGWSWWAAVAVAVVFTDYLLFSGAWSP
jgi:hypothetical protein